MHEETELARAFAARESWAYETAYRLYGRTLFQAALGVLRDDQEAQDCVHDVMLRLWRRGSGFCVERGSVGAFLAVSARNEALSRLRKRVNRERIATGAALKTAEVVAADVSEAVSERFAIDAALQLLSEKERQSIVLAYYRHFTHAEIADELNEPVGTIKSRLSAALRRLRVAFVSQEIQHAGH